MKRVNFSNVLQLTIVSAASMDKVSDREILERVKIEPLP